MSTPLEYTSQPVAAPARVATWPLIVMMFLQYAVWGVWLPVLAGYLSALPTAGGLGFSGAQVGFILGLAVSIGAVTAPFLAGQVADRYLNAERALSLLLVVGGIAIFMMGTVKEYGPFLALAIVYSLAYMPTLSLTNSICFQNLPDETREKDFPRIRLWGTIGWIVASNAFGILWLNLDDKTANTARIADALKISGVVSFFYAGFALFLLPKTPPKKDVENPLAFLRAFSLLKHPGFLTVTLIALPVSMIHQAYFLRMFPYLTDVVGFSQKWAPGIMTIGQFSEIAFLVALGLLIKKLGYKWVLVLGAAAYGLRFGLFAVAPNTAVVAAMQTLHGLCYGCFFAGAYLYVEKVAPKDVRHSAQTVFGIVILGLGPVLSAFYNGAFDGSAGATPPNYQPFWLAQAGIAVGAAVLLALLFKENVPLEIPKPTGFEVLPVSDSAKQ